MNAIWGERNFAHMENYIIYMGSMRPSTISSSVSGT